jgi:asparagine synthase (glutamine-hydrolysing)
MCGIAASFSLSGGDAVAWALPYMQHRGPDGSGVMSPGSGAPTLEHCRLAIIDPENRDADQPFTDSTGRCTIVYNGELFNYREIRSDLQARGVRFRTESDTEVVLMALATSGEAALQRFRGMFAFVLWDAEERSLLAARDQIGVKPLYYAFANGVFAAASELRTIIRHPAVAARLNPESVVEYLSFGFVGGGSTLIEGVHKLEPGHLLKVIEGTYRTARYWDPLPAAGEPILVDDADQPVALLERLEVAVTRSLVSDVPVSLMLSGGLDSSAVAAIAARHGTPGDLTAYSVSFGLPTDESAAAARLAGELGIRHREIFLDEHMLGAGFEEWLAGMDVPSANPTWIAVSRIAAAVQEDGHKVLLSGDGADELFGGYNRWMTYLRFHDRYWRHTPSAVRRLVGAVSKPFARGLAGDIARRARHAGPLFVGSRPFHDDDLSRYLGPAALAAATRVPPETRVETILAGFRSAMPNADALAWMSYLALKTDLVEDYLVRLDTMGMGKSIEGRVPLLDVDLAELAFRLPQRAKLGPGYEQKALFRRAVSTFLPSYITERPKQGFCPPVADWSVGLLASRIGRAEPLVDLGLVAPGAAGDLIARGGDNASFALWAMGTLSVWCKNNL